MDSSFDTSLSGFGSFRNATASYSATSSSLRASATATGPHRPRLAQPPRFYERFQSGGSPLSARRFDLDAPAFDAAYRLGPPHDADDAITLGTLASVGSPSPIGGGVGGYSLVVAGGGGDVVGGIGPAISSEEQQRLADEIKVRPCMAKDAGKGSSVASRSCAVALHRRIGVPPPIAPLAPPPPPCIMSHSLARSLSLTPIHRSALTHSLAPPCC